MTWTLTVPRDRGDDADVVVAWCWAAGALGVEVRADVVAATFGDGPDAELAAGWAGATWAEDEDVDWQAAWRAGIEAVVAGDVEVVPTWLADTTPRVARYRLVLDPDRAFGSGHHDTTAGCLEALTALDLAGRSVLDVGTGTGILAMAAATMGASRVVAVDLDADAVEVARRNVTDAGLDIDVHVGSVGDVDTTFDVVVANLLTHTVLALADDLVAATVPGGTLVVSGVGAERARTVADALRTAGLTDVMTALRGEWAILHGTKPS